MRNAFVKNIIVITLHPWRPRGGQLSQEKRRRKFLRMGETTAGMLLLTNQFHDLFE